MRRGNFPREDRRERNRRGYEDVATTTAAEAGTCTELPGAKR